jgi:hypothetical protein
VPKERDCAAKKVLCRERRLLYKAANKEGSDRLHLLPWAALQVHFGPVGLADWQCCRQFSWLLARTRTA